jgi:serine/threonine protein kinase/tetratricopeptide (TPR) repeat protein
MKCPSCGAENPALAERCSACGKALSYPEDNQTLGDIDRKTVSKQGEKPERTRAPRTNVEGGAGAPGRGGGDGGTRPLSEKRGDPQVISKTPSGVGPNTPGPQGVDDGTVFGEEPSGAPSSESPTGYGERSPLSFSFSGILEPGMDFGPRFRIEKLLGEGGMGKVYKAFDKELGRTVALKTLQPELIKDPNVILRFKQELLLASKISHKNILRIHDLSEWEGVKFITMAFIEGDDLSQLLKEERPFPIDRSLKIARQLCEALDAAHSEGVVHRDFKPHNVLVGKNDHIYVSDFGLATSLETAKLGMTRSGAFVGTPRYMSPEQVEGKQVDSRSDLYSFGLVFYEMVAGEVPFAGESTWQVMYQRVKEQPSDIKVVNPETPDNVARIIMHCLEREPADRYQNAREIIADIDAGRSPEMSVTSMYRTPSPAGRSVQISLPVIRNRWLYAAIAGVLVLAGLFFAIPKTRHWLLPGPHAETPETKSEGPGSKSQAKFVAVLPFNVAGDESSLRYVAEGLVEAISARLFQLKDVRLTSSAAAAKVDPKASLSRVAKDLGANLIVHGTVQGSGDNLRVAVSLDDVAENRLVWSQEFTGVRGDLLILEDHMYEGLAEALALKPSNEELARATAHPTENIEAYDLYLKGRAAMRGQQAISNIKKAIGLYEEALKKDPSFALAYAGIADATLILYDDKKDSFLAQKALGAAQQAQRLNDNLPEVHFSLGKVYSASGRTAEAIIELKRALELAPNSDDGYRALGKAYLAIGQKEQALQAYRKAVDINPYYWINYNSIGQAYSQLGDYDKALVAFRHVIELEPQNSFGYLNVGAMYFQQGKYEESIPYFQKSLEIQPDDKTYNGLGTAYFYLKRYNDSVPMFEKAMQMSPNVEEFTGNLADAYRWSGQREKANATYDKAIALAYKELAVNPRNSDTMGSLALYHAKKGMPSEALNFIQRARSINKEDVRLVYTAAVVEALANHSDNALGLLREAFKRGYSVQEASSDPELDSLRSRPEFEKLLAEFKNGG